MFEVLESLYKLQKSCAPIVVSLGCVSDTNHVQHECLVIKEAPPTVIRWLASQESVTMSMRPQGLHVTKLHNK